MAQDIMVPEIGENVNGAWSSPDRGRGRPVEADQTLLELETDKAVVAIPSPFEGMITEILVERGRQVRSAQVIMPGETDGETAGSPDDTDRRVGSSRRDTEADGHGR